MRAHPLVIVGLLSDDQLHSPVEMMEEMQNNGNKNYLHEEKHTIFG